VSRLDALDPKRTLGDTAGHGTQMALVAAGSVQPRGAPDSDEGVPLIAVRAFDERGLTTDFSLMRGITHALNEGARVINLSWGSETDSGFIANAVAFAQFQGAVVVAAAGNEPTGRKLYPAAYDGVVAVAALDGQGQPWKNSNHGDFVDVAAPGSATMPLGYQGPPGAYAGTSIASAYVAREIALYLNRHPKANAREAITAVQAALSASFKGYGQGTLDAAAVMRLRKN
jgi:subtilisin family serine protease